MRKFFFTKYNLSFWSIVLTLCTIMGCSHGKTKNGWVLEKLNGRVQLVKQRTFNCSERFGEVFKEDLAEWGQYEMEFTDQGNIVQKNYFDQQGNLISTEKHYYNANNLDTLIVRFSNFGTVKWKQERVFDQEMNLVQTKNIGSDGTISRLWKTIFDDNNNEVKSDGFDKDGALVFQWTYKYDEFGNCIEETIKNIEENSSNTSFYKFDENQNIIESKGYGIQSYEYIYDDNKNWISKTIFSNNRATEMIERTITYW